MGDIIASGSGNYLIVGNNCQKIDFFSSDITVSEVSTFTLYKIIYNNSKFGKIYLAATRTKDNTFIAQNKDFNFSWKIVQDEGSTEPYFLGSHTKRCEKNSLAISENLLFQTPILNNKNSKLNFELK